MKISVDAKEKIAAALHAVQSRCRARTLDTLDIVDAAKRLTTDLDSAGVLKKNRRGVTGAVHHGFNGSIPGAYKGCPEGTTVHLEHGAKGWFVTGVCRNGAKTIRGYINRSLELTPTAQADALRRLQDWR